jgi:hypothetical protein
MKLIFWLLVLVVGGAAGAEDLIDSSADVGRDPSAVKVFSSKRAYPGGADEEDLQVQARIPEAQLKTDARSVQREVYKDLYNQEMKDERQETVEE